MSSKYETYTPEQLEEHFSNYLMDSWSYSKVSCFARNEKAFEKQYIYMEPDRRSSSFSFRSEVWALLPSP